MRTKDEKLHARRKTEILNAATTCFAVAGIRQTTMQEICKKANISPGALYRYFESKDDIIKAIAAQYAAANDELIDYLASQKDIVRSLQAATPMLVKELSQPETARLTLEIAAEAARNSDVSEPFLEGEKQFKRALIRLLEQAQHAGAIDRTVDVKAFVHLFINLLDGVAGSFAFPTDVSKKRLADSLGQLIFQTLSPTDKEK